MTYWTIFSEEMVTIKTITDGSNFDELESFLEDFEIPEVFQNLWNQFKATVPNVKNEAVVDTCHANENYSTKGAIYAWWGRYVLYKRRGDDHFGFAETVRELRKIKECQRLFIQTDMYWAILYFSEEQKRVFGFLYVFRPRPESPAKNGTN